MKKTILCHHCEKPIFYYKRHNGVCSWEHKISDANGADNGSYQACGYNPSGWNQLARVAGEKSGPLAGCWATPSRQKAVTL